jgi:hypothetical protein
MTPEANGAFEHGIFEAGLPVEFLIPAQGGGLPA